MPKLVPVLGRLFSYQRSDPSSRSFVKQVFNDAEANDRLGMLQSVFSNTEGCRRFLQQLGVKRLELNNVVQGIGLEDVEEIRYTLHMPFVFVSSTRYCPTVEILQERPRGERTKRILDCHRECQIHHFELKTRNMDEKLYLYGNTIFFSRQRQDA
jgi:hypothetical protein